MDGIDAALIETDGEFSIREIDFLSHAFSNECVLLLKSAELAMRKAEGDFRLAEAEFDNAIEEYLHHELGITKQDIATLKTKLQNYLSAPLSLHHVIQHFTDLHAEIVLSLLHKQSLLAEQIEVIGFHGQTLLHKPQQKITIQIGDGKHLANRLGIKVVNNFRENDVLSGGQGAPLVPLFHLALAEQHKKLPAVIVNCGGIANVSILPNNNPLAILGFDTGPGNNLVDRYIKQITQGEMRMDQDGSFGKKGKSHPDILALLYEKSISHTQGNYYDLAPPKSLDSSDLQLIPELHTLSHEDACRTLEAFTADSIVTSVRKACDDMPTTWILCGGGWNNPIIHDELITRLAQHRAHAYHASDLGWNSQALEAQAFAYYAVRHLKNLPISFPKTTHVSRPTVGGVLNIPG